MQIFRLNVEVLISVKKKASIFCVSAGNGGDVPISR